MSTGRVSNLVAAIVWRWRLPLSRASGTAPRKPDACDTVGAASFAAATLSEAVLACGGSGDFPVRPAGWPPELLTDHAVFTG